MSGSFKIQSFEYFLHKAFNGALITRDTSGIFRDFKNMGATHVTLGWNVAVDENTGKFLGSYDNKETYVPSFDEVAAVAALAKQAGLGVIIKPQYTTAHAVGLPDNINVVTINNATFNSAEFFSGLKSYIEKVSRLAQSVGADVLVLGTENGGLDTIQYREPWLSVIATARQSYSGTLSYDANSYIGRTYGHGADMVAFWDQLDLIGVSGYYPLSDSADAGYQEVYQGWFNNKVSHIDYIAPRLSVPEKLLELSARYGKPLYFAEYGGQAFHGVIQNSSGAGPAEKSADYDQHDWLFRSMFEIFSNYDDWFLGVNIWGAINTDPAMSDPIFPGYLLEYPTNFDVRGRPAGDTVQKWFTGQNTAPGLTVAFGGGDDTITGGANSDVFFGGAGDDLFDGRGGVDTSAVSGTRSQYGVSHGAGRITLSGPDGVDQLVNMERIRFDDGTLVVNPSDPAFSVYRLYEAALDRAPDGMGLTAWTYAGTTGMTMTEMAHRFMAAPEFVQRFGSPDNAGFVDLLYRNVLDRPADEAGASGWIHALNSGQMSREDVLLQFADSAENIAKVNASVGDGVWLA